MRKLISYLCSACLLVSPLASAKDEQKPELPTLELSVNSQKAAANDLAQATAYIEHTDPRPASLAQKVNSIIAEAIRISKTYSAVKVQSQGTQTYPIYNSKNESKIDAWRMRSEIALESTDIAQLSELIGKLQNTLAISSIHLRPSTATLKKAQDEALVEGIKAFQARAELSSKTLGKKYRIKQLNINTQDGRPPVLYKGRAMAMSADSAAPIEGGESQVQVTLSGVVELLDE